MYGETSLRPDITPTGVLAQAPTTLAPARWRRAAAAIGRFVARTATVLAGLLAGAIVGGVGQEFLAEEVALDLAIGIAIAVWFTAGRGWLRLRTLPRLLIVFAIVAGAWLFIFSPLLPRLGIPL